MNKLPNQTITPNDYFNLTGFWPASSNLLANMGNGGITDFVPYYPYQQSNQDQSQNPRLRRCTPFEVMFGLCPPITPEESIEINTQEKIKQGMPEAQARQDAQDEALELKAKIPTMNQLMENIFGVNYQTIRLILFAIIALIVILVLKR